MFQCQIRNNKIPAVSGTIVYKGPIIGDIDSCKLWKHEDRHSVDAGGDCCWDFIAMH